MDGKNEDGAGSSSANTKAALLDAACQAAGGLAALAGRLGISEAMLRKCMSGTFAMPDPLFLRAVDVLLEERERCFDLAPPAEQLPDGRADV
ncbi:MAG TPA: hypothetical protein VN782_07550 [Usitatibacter sp.]|nr:hypothetical protein [Usitatibacter sp.]